MPNFNRRQFSTLALTSGLFYSSRSLLSAAEKPNSKVAGVLIGMNVPYNFGGNNVSAEEVLKNCVELGVSGGVGSTVQLRCGTTPLFEGRVGRRKNRVAVRIERELPRPAPGDR